LWGSKNSQNKKKLVFIFEHVVLRFPSNQLSQMSRPNGSVPVISLHSNPKSKEQERKLIFNNMFGEIGGIPRYPNVPEEHFTLGSDQISYLSSIKI